jgi:hypothetical protein
MHMPAMYITHTRIMVRVGVSGVMRCIYTHILAYIHAGNILRQT